MLRRVLPLLVLAAALALPAAASGAVRSSIFYYPWYGTPQHDGKFIHWQQNGGEPPHRIASSYYPARGPYSSADRLVLAAQMDEIRRAGIDQISVSWWGWGSIEDRRLELLLPEAQDRTASTSPHTSSRTGAGPRQSTASDIAHLRELGIRDFYVYGPQDDTPEAWAAARASLPQGVRLFAQTHLVGWAAAGALRRRLHVRHPHLHRRPVRAAVRPGAEGQAPLRPVGRAGLRRAARGRGRPRAAPAPRAHVRRHVGERDPGEGRPRHDHELQRVARGHADRARAHAPRLRRLRRRLGHPRARRGAGLPRPHGVLDGPARSRRR